MKSPAKDSHAPALEGLSGYQASIHAATGAPRHLLGIIENIMRQEVFHSTLDWQTQAQLNQGAKRAYAIYSADSAFYDTSAALHTCEFHVMQAEQQLKEAQAAGIEATTAAANLANAESQRALARQSYERVCGYAVA
jgi:hypothetical protein